MGSDDREVKLLGAEQLLGLLEEPVATLGRIQVERRDPDDWEAVVGRPTAFSENATRTFDDTDELMNAIGEPLAAWVRYRAAGRDALTSIIATWIEAWVDDE